MQTITTKYHGMTHTKPARWTAETSSGMKFSRTEGDGTIEFTHAIIVEEFAIKLGWEGTMYGGGTKHPNVMVWVFADPYNAVILPFG